MRVNGQSVLFDRRVYVIFTPNVIDTKTDTTILSPTELSNQLQNGAIVICYDTQKDSNLCSRIDFWTRTLGNAEKKKGADQIAIINIYNLGDELRKMFDAYNYPANFNRWYSVAIETWSVCLAVGYADGQLQTIFSGVVKSFNSIRQQNEKNVDIIWKFYCSNRDKKTIKEEDKATEEKLEQIDKFYPLPMCIKAENVLRQVVMENPRQVYEMQPISTTPRQIDSSFIGDWIRGNTDFKETKMMSSITVRRRITPENFNNYYKIEYQDKSLERDWQRIIQILKIPKADDLVKALKTVALKINNNQCCIEKKSEDNRQIIKIYRAGGNANTSSQKHIIKNFQNVTKDPVLEENNMTISIILEPSIHSFDSVELQVDKEFKNSNVYSFDIQYKAQYSGSLFTNQNFIVGSSDKNIAAQKEYGNIFFRPYLITYLEHSGSTHDAVWETKMNLILGEGNE